MAMTLERADNATAAKITGALGREDLTNHEIEEIRGVIQATGAVKDVEDLIEGLLSNALTAANSDEIAPSARELLVELATTATRRSH
jgi:geranylgeranyl diphosphate synthase type I